MYNSAVTLGLICCLFVVTLSVLTKNVLKEWWKPLDFGSAGLLDTSSYIDPYRTDTSRFRPYIYGFVSTTTPITTYSFEECMEKCIQDIKCKAFEINMLFLPFRCRVSVKPCTDGECSEFNSHPHWKHFVRDNDNTHIAIKSTVSLDTLDNKYKERQTSRLVGYGVEKLTNNTLFDYIEVEVLDASPDTISIDYVWFEYKLTASSNWLKCQRVQLPQIKSRYRVQNMCIQYEFSGASKTECDVLKESWEYHSITPRTTKIRNINFDDNNIPSLKTCSDSLMIDTATNSKIQYIKLGIVYAVRLFSNIGKFELNSMKLVTVQQTFVTAPTIVTKSGDNTFKLPHHTTSVSNDPRITVADWYYDILKDGGHLWCRNADQTTDIGVATNVFKRMHHTCYYRGSTLSKTNLSPKSDKERIHYFNQEQCSFDIDKIPHCTKAWVAIYERCQGWDYCAVTLAEGSDVKIYHRGDQGLNNIFNGKNVDFPIVSWKSGWNRAQTQDSEHNWSVDYITDIFLVLHECESRFDDFSGCSRCSSTYFEAEYNPRIKYENLRIYKYDRETQFCRPQEGIWENECKENFFCPKGWPNNEFEDHQYWICRTNFNGVQQVSTGTQLTQQPVNQGFACVS